jgi:hypothetical protein
MPFIENIFIFISVSLICMRFHLKLLDQDSDLGIVNHSLWMSSNQSTNMKESEKGDLSSSYFPEMDYLLPHFPFP